MYKKHQSEFVNGKKFIYIRQNLTLKIIMHCRTPVAIEFRTKLGFNKHYLILTEEQSVLRKIIFAKRGNIVTIFCFKL